MEMHGELRNWIDMQNEVAAEPMNAASEKARAAKEKEKELKERLKTSMDKTTLMPNKAASIEENKGLISQIKEAQEAKRAALNEYGGAELIGNKDKWFMFTEDEEKVIEEYIATRSKRQIRKRIRV